MRKSSVKKSMLQNRQDLTHSFLQFYVDVYIKCWENNVPSLRQSRLLLDFDVRLGLLFKSSRIKKSYTSFIMVFGLFFINHKKLIKKASNVRVLWFFVLIIELLWWDNCAELHSLIAYFVFDIGCFLLNCGLYVDKKKPKKTV